MTASKVIEEIKILPPDEVRKNLPLASSDRAW